MKGNDGFIIFTQGSINIPKGIQNISQLGGVLNLFAELETLLFDPQTSGGMLIAVDKSQADELVRRLKDAGISHSALCGQVTGKSEGSIVLKV